MVTVKSVMKSFLLCFSKHKLRDYIVFGLLKSKSNIVLGVDISSTAVKVLELAVNGRGYKVEAFAIQPLPNGAIVENNIQNVGAISSTLSAALAQMRTSTKNAAVAVSGSAVITKLIEMDASFSDEEMESHILVEADQYIPYAMDEVAIDFEVQSLHEDDPTKADVLLAACRLDQVELRSDVIKKSGLKAKIVDVEALAMERARELITPYIQWKNDEKILAIVDIGAFKTTLHIMQRGRVIYTREQLFGGRQQLTDDIQRHYGLSAEDAEKAKKSGQDSGDYHKEVLMPFIDVLVQQVSRALQFFLSSSQHKSISALVLTGGASNVSGLKEKAQSILEMPVFHANPFVDMTVSKQVDSVALEQEAPSLMIACGLAMRSFD